MPAIAQILRAEKGIVAYTLLANHVPINAEIIAARTIAEHAEDRELTAFLYLNHVRLMSGCLRVEHIWLSARWRHDFRIDGDMVGQQRVATIPFFQPKYLGE